MDMSSVLRTPWTYFDNEHDDKPLDFGVPKYWQKNSQFFKIWLALVAALHLPILPGSSSCHATSKSDDGFEDRSHAITAFDDADDFTPSCRVAQNQQLGVRKKPYTFWRWRCIINWKWITAWWFPLFLYICFFIFTIEHGCYDYWIWV